MFRPVRAFRLFGLTFVLASTIAASACAPQTSASTSSASSADVPQQVEPPCANAELHERFQYQTCNGGKIDQREEDLWCCPSDGSEKKTDSLIAATGAVCAASTATSSCKPPVEPKKWEPCDTSDQGARTEFNKACNDAGCATVTYSYDAGNPNANPPVPPSCWTKCVDPANPGF